MANFDMYIIKRIKENNINLAKIKQYIKKLKKIQEAHEKIKQKNQAGTPTRTISVQESIKNYLRQSQQESHTGVKRKLSHNSDDSSDSINKIPQLPVSKRQKFYDMSPNNPQLQ
jgi:DNA-binding transcriptional MerR regulator